MGVDRRPIKRATSNSDAEPEVLLVEQAPPSSPPQHRCHGAGRRGSRSDAAVGTGSRPWIKSASSICEVTRSPSYLNGAAGLTLSPARAADPTGAGAAQHQKPAVACSPSPVTVSPPAPVRMAGRQTKPRPTAVATTTTTTTATAAARPLAGAEDGASDGPHHLLPPPVIQREASGSFSKGVHNHDIRTWVAEGRGGGAVRWGGGSEGGVSAGPDISLARLVQCPLEQWQRQKRAEEEAEKDEGRNMRKGEAAVGPCPRTPISGQHAPSTPEVESRTPLECLGAVGKAGNMAFPATPTTLRNPETPGFMSTPSICSPPVACHPQRHCRWSHQRRGCSGGGSFAGSSGSGGGGGGDDDARGTGATELGPETATPPRSRRSAAARSGRRGTGKAESWRGRPTRKEQLRDASSAERFSEDPDGEGGESSWLDAGRIRCRRVSRRRCSGGGGKGMRTAVAEQDEEVLLDFRGRMAAVASATRLCLVASASATNTETASQNSRNTKSNSSVLATPPHPIPAATSAPALPRRRLLSAHSPISALRLPAEGRKGGGSSVGLPPTTPTTEGTSSRSEESGGGGMSPRRHCSGGTGTSTGGWSTGDELEENSNAAYTSNVSSSLRTTPAQRGIAGSGIRAGGTAAAAAGGGGGGIPPGQRSCRDTTPVTIKSEAQVGRREPGPERGRGRGRRRRRGRGPSALDPRTAVKPSELTVPKTRPWPDFEDGIRYEPPESMITTNSRRSDWVVPHGSAMQALAAALDEAAGSTACSSPLDMGEEKRTSIRQRYRERAEHFRLIQAARESSAATGSALLMVMRQRRQAEEDELRAKAKRDTRAARLRDKILVRMLEGRRAVFLAWARHARTCRMAREKLRSREESRQSRVFSAWREEAHRLRRVREFTMKHLAGSTRTTFAAWKSDTKRSIAARRAALGHLQGAQKSRFVAWRDTTRKNFRRRELALERSPLFRSALDNLAGTQGPFQRWRAWAARVAAAKRMARRKKEAGLRRCFLALAGNQLRLRRRQEERRIATLAAFFDGWRVGLGRLLRARLLPVEGGDVDGGGSGGHAGTDDTSCIAAGAGDSSSRLLDWGFAPPMPLSLERKGAKDAGGKREQRLDAAMGRLACASEDGGGSCTSEGRDKTDSGLCETQALAPNYEPRTILLPPSAFFAPEIAVAPAVGSCVEGCVVKKEIVAGSAHVADGGGEGGAGRSASQPASQRGRGREEHGEGIGGGGTGGGSSTGHGD